METDQINISIGNIVLGPAHPVLIQSMCNVSTMHTQACVDQCIRIFDAGGGLVRITARNIHEARNLENIRKELNHRGYHQPLCADVHFNPQIAMTAATRVEKVRINPGNFAAGDIEKPFLELLKTCRKYHTALRIGVNHGSLSESILERYGNTPEGMVESALEYLRICKRECFRHVVVSLKSSNTRVMIYANRLMCRRMSQEQMQYPLHLGVTEAGAGEDGRIRSAAGIGTLLNEGTGDTIRVSLTEEPELEIPVARKLLETTSGNRGNTGNHYATEFRRRMSDKYGILGGGQVPVVIAGTEGEPARTAENAETEADFFFVPGHLRREKVSPAKKYLLNAEDWIMDEYPGEHFFPLFDLPGFRSRTKVSSQVNFILVRPEELQEAMQELVRSKQPCCLVYLHDGKSSSREKFLTMAEQNEFRFPVLVRAEYHDQEEELFRIRAAGELAWYFIDGYADGIWLENAPDGPNHRYSLSCSTSFKILQASRARMTQTEYIACPSCGRTLFNIQDTLAKVQKATFRLRHLKIAVMGCIVNGPGEMADADYGCVGSAKGKVDLYRNRKAVKKGIREEDAVRELVFLIKENGDWID